MNYKLRIKNYLKCHCEQSEAISNNNGKKQTDPRLRKDDNFDQLGFAPILVIGVVLLVGIFVFLYFFFMRNNQQLDNFRASDIPSGVVVDAEGNICETQDPMYCHETEDIETWKDDGLP